MAVIIENEPAYFAAVRRNIKANARKTFERTYTDWQEVLAFIEPGRVDGSFGNYTYQNNFIGSLAKAFDTFGKLTDGQVNAVRKCIAQREQRKAEWQDKQAALNATRKHIGTVGDKLTLTLTVRNVIAIESLYGVSWIYIAEDSERNVIIYKGKSSAFDGINKGDSVTVTATVSAHGVREGVKQTVINRPKAVKGD